MANPTLSQPPDASIASSPKDHSYVRGVFLTDGKLTRHRPGHSFRPMTAAKRIRQKVLVLFFRLVMIVSLAGYSTYAVETVMHADFGSGLLAMEMDSGESHHAPAIASAEDGMSHDHSGPEKTKPSCCVDYCGVAALICPGATISHPRSMQRVALLDDKDAFGRLSQLHRPPSI